MFKGPFPHGRFCRFGLHNAECFVEANLSSGMIAPAPPGMVKILFFLCEIYHINWFAGVFPSTLGVHVSLGWNH